MSDPGSARQPPPDERIEWRHGSVEERRGGLPLRLRDRHGAAVWSFWWRDSALAAARIALPDGREVTLRPGPEHAVFGPTDEIVAPGGEPVARFGAVTWAAPETIPPLDHPGALPSGAGTAILNAIAARARAVGTATIRYRGPYPTAALFDALADSFVPAGEPGAALTAFTAHVEARAARARMDEVPVDFEPQPFERHWPAPGVCVQIRDGVEKVFAGGRAYARDAAGPRRLRRRGDGYVAALEIGGAPWARVLELDARGEVTSGPEPIPPVSDPLLGRALPPEVARALADALPGRAPALLRGPLRSVLEDTPLVWGDPGADEAIVRDGTILLHPALADQFEGRELLEAIARAVEGPAQRLAQAELARTAAGGRL